MFSFITQLMKKIIVGVIFTKFTFAARLNPAVINMLFLVISFVKQVRITAEKK